MYKKYFFKNHFSDYLGLQSEIENELIILLKTWIPNANDDKKIVLFVDDIDRCKIEQVIDIVDGLRVILDNPEIHNRLIIITAIDEGILKQALEHKYNDIKKEESIKISFMYKEYLEKIFIIGLKLNTLSDSEAEEILLTILPDNLTEEVSKNNNDLYTRENNESINQSNNELQKDNLGNTNENITEVISDEATMETNELENHDAEVGEINIHEKKYLLDAIKRLDNITPRKIRIFYYKYLIMKILFDIRIKEKNLILDWNKDKNEKITIDLLIHLANDKKVSDFRCSIKKEILKELAYVAEMVSVL
ncbi:hypothetical protein SMN_0433 [Sulfurospirillum multivorans]|uniref:KAP NTPase domain-containing protein n=1 Tax=Sulfurospirillum multivorans TaxID=66821 RepID=A0ABX5YY26_SULMU|nr:hypothetical protein SMN_0433 [Sulfurospirillum multivorans]